MTIQKNSLMLHELREQDIGQLLPASKWITVTQQMITLFSKATFDPDPMHVDPDWCVNNSPFGCTIAFGFQTIALLTPMIENILMGDKVNHKEWGGFSLNYGFNRLRLLSPVKVNSRIRLHAKLNAVIEKKPGELLKAFKVTVQIEGEEKPALVGEWLTMMVFSEEKASS